MSRFWVVLLIILCGCEQITDHGTDPSSIETSIISFNWQKIPSRDDGSPSSRYPLYTAKVPSDWIRKDPSPTDSIEDTRLPLCEFFIKENNEEIRITVHNFPSDYDVQRIPPIAQIQRWEKQFTSLDPTQKTITPVSQGGFVGLFLESQGIINGKQTKLLGWAMQLAPEYYRQFSHDNSFFAKQRRADYTIKALGPPELVDKHLQDILIFADSFGLIEELPSPS